MRRRQRLQTITRVLKENRVSNQSELKDLLAARGCVVSQPSLSRDLQSLGAYRTRNAGGGYCYHLPGEGGPRVTPRVFNQRFSLAARSVQSSGFVVLVHTSPGDAQGVARLLDEAEIEGLLGTVAGDDTVICITNDDRTSKAVCQRLSALID
jgi:transcriptional regulator of arginine metabolism